MYWETEKFIWLALLRYLLYYSGLEPNLQYIWGMPVISSNLNKIHTSIGKLIFISFLYRFSSSLKSVVISLWLVTKSSWHFNNMLAVKSLQPGLLNWNIWGWRLDLYVFWNIPRLYSWIFKYYIQALHIHRDIISAGIKLIIFSF